MLNAIGAPNEPARVRKPDRAPATFGRPLWSEAVEDRDSVKRE